MCESHKVTIRDLIHGGQEFMRVEILQAVPHESEFKLRIEKENF